MKSIVTSYKNDTGGKITHTNSFIKEIIQNRYLYILALPGIIYFLIFNYLPLAGLVLAFENFIPTKGIFGSKFVGLDNFRFFFTSNSWLKVTFNTLFLNILFIVTGLFMQLVISIMINELGSKYFKKITQSLIFLPNFISWAVIATFSMAFFATDEGLLNNISGAIGLPEINYYQNAAVWPFLLVMFRLWKGVGFGSVIYLSTITGIDQELYEAALIDGASRIQRIIYITLPMLKSTTIVLFIMAVGQIFYGDFGMIYALVGDNPLLYSTTDVIDTFVYRALRYDNDIGMSAAVGLYQSVVGFLIVIAANGIVKRYEKESSLF